MHLLKLVRYLHFYTRHVFVSLIDVDNLMVLKTLIYQRQGVSLKEVVTSDILFVLLGLEGRPETHRVLRVRTGRSKKNHNLYRTSFHSWT